MCARSTALNRLAEPLFIFYMIDPAIRSVSVYDSYVYVDGSPAARKQLQQGHFKVRQIRKAVENLSHVCSQQRVPEKSALNFNGRSFCAERFFVGTSDDGVAPHNLPDL